MWRTMILSFKQIGRNKIRSFLGHITRTTVLLSLFPRQALRQFCHPLTSGLTKTKNGL